MIKEIVIEFKEGSDEPRRRIFSAIMAEINKIAWEQYQDDDKFNIPFEDLPDFPGKFVINVFDENEELMEVIDN